MLPVLHIGIIGMLILTRWWACSGPAEAPAGLSVR
ncbi:hypothetical protein SGLAM104S_00696 [Streptomyces glaucescens]